MEWSKKCHLDFNIEKCKIMKVKHIFQTEYELNGRKLQEVAEEGDLGIFVTDDLKPVCKGGSEGNASSGCHQEKLCVN